MRRLFRATVSFHRKLYGPEREGEKWLDTQVAPEGDLWWNPRARNRAHCGEVTGFGREIFSGHQLVSRSVDIRVLRAIKQSPLALDLYAWVTWRVFKLDKAAFIPWKGLMDQMGSEYARSDNFSKKAKASLRKIQGAYPALKLTFAKGGLVLYPSPTAIAPAAKRQS